MSRTGLLLLSFLIACGGPKAREPSRQATTPSIVDAGGGGDAGPESDVPTLDAIAARGATDAPQMREVRRVPDAAKGIDLPPADRDVCFRIAIASSRPLRARLEDAAKVARGDVPASGTFLLVPPRGPACAKKGESLRLVVEGGDGATARAIVWQSP